MELRDVARKIVRFLAVGLLVAVSMGSHCTPSPPTPPPPTILDANSPARSFSGAGGVESLCTGGTFPTGHPYEWQTVIGAVDDSGAATVSGVAGNVVKADCSNDDLVFTHPGGYDWETYLAIDDAYLTLLGKSNLTATISDGEYADALAVANRLGIHEKGIMGVETDQAFSQPRYRACSPVPVASKDQCPSRPPSSPGQPRCDQTQPNPMNREAIFGRWIVDCAHKDYHTEIHPPLMTVTGTVSSPTRSDYTIEGRPFLVSQQFNGNGWYRELGTFTASGDALCLVGVGFGIPCLIPQSFIATLLAPFSGIAIMTFTIRPPGPLGQPAGTPPDPVSILQLHGKVYVRNGVTLTVSPGRNNDIITVVMNDTEYKLPDFGKYDSTQLFMLSDLGEKCDTAHPNWTSDECLLFGLEAATFQQLIALTPTHVVNVVAKYRQLDANKIYTDEATNQPTAAPDATDFQVVSAPNSLFPIQGVFSLEWVNPLAANPSPLQFVAPNDPGGEKITLTNSGTDPVTISSISISGPNSRDFKIVADSCGATVPPRASCSLTVAYTASAVGLRQANVVIADGTVAPLSIPMSGPGWITLREPKTLGLQYALAP